MSLMDGLLLDGLLDGIEKSVVYVALRRDSASTRGRGTADDPYDGNLYLGEYRLDTVLRALKPNTTVILGPGEFLTQGFKNENPSSGWSARSGCRIIGAGWAPNTVTTNPSATYIGPTVLKLAGHVTGSNVAVGCKTTPTYEANGFEIAHLVIDCALPATTQIAAEAININGSHIRVHDLRVINFGATASAGVACNVITVAQTRSDQPTAFDCVVSECVVESPSSNSDSGATVTALRLVSIPNGATAFYHDACVLRNNVVDCGANGLSRDYRGISASGGRGTILEQNRVLNCKYGFFVPNTSSNLDHPTIDLIARDNYLYNVLYGFRFMMDADNVNVWKVGRFVLTANLIELATSGSPIGVEIDGEGSTARLFRQVIIRKNQIRHVDGSTGPSNTVGIDLDSVNEGIVEENLINIGATPASPDPAYAIIRSSTANVTTFNNQSTAGKFLPAVYGSIKTPDLVTDAQDWMLAM